MQVSKSGYADWHKRLPSRRATEEQQLLTSIRQEFHFPGKQVVVVLDKVAATQALPKELYVDNGPEFISQALDAWAHKNNVKLCFSRPGKPTDNAYIEFFNGKLRTECLDQNWFLSLQEAKEKLSSHRNEHNSERPHTALNFLTPEQHLAKWRSEQQTKDVQTEVN